MKTALLAYIILAVAVAAMLAVILSSCAQPSPGNAPVVLDATLIGRKSVDMLYMVGGTIQAMRFTDPTNNTVCYVGVGGDSMVCRDMK